MDLGIKILVGLLSVPLLALGAKTVLKPMSMLEDLGVDPRGTIGLNSIRGMLGGLLVSAGAMMVMGLALHDTTWFLAVAFIMAIVVVSRVIGVAVDGFDQALVKPLVVEIVLIVVLIGAHLRLGAT